MITIALERRARSDRETMHRAGLAAATRAAKRVRDASRARGARISIEKDSCGKPQARIGSRRFPLSISHAGVLAIGVAASQRSLLIGADIERIRQFASETRVAFLTPQERAVIETQPVASRARLDTLAWSIKESAQKALGVGLHLDPQAVDCSDVLRDQCSGPYALKIRDKSVAVRAQLGNVGASHVFACIALPRNSLYCL